MGFWLLLRVLEPSLELGGFALLGRRLFWLERAHF